MGELDTCHRIERNLEEDWIEEWKTESFLGRYFTCGEGWKLFMFQEI